MTGLSARCKASWWMSIAFATLPPRMPLSLMKPVADRGRVWLCWALKMIFNMMASRRASSLILLLPGTLTCVGLPHSKILNFLPHMQQLMPESLMTKTMLPHHLQLRRVSTLHQVRLHHQTSTMTLLHRLLHMGMSSKLYVFKPFWSLLTKGGEAWVDSLQAGPYGWLILLLHLPSAYNSRFWYIWFFEL